MRLSNKWSLPTNVESMVGDTLKGVIQTIG